jgi:hypothetical protein
MSEEEEKKVEGGEKAPLHTRFIVNKHTFEDFIKDVECKGIIHVESEKVKSGVLFENFLIEAKDGRIVVIATDTKQNRVIAQHSFRGEKVKILDEGSVPITNTKDFITAMKRLGGTRKDKVRMELEYPDEDGNIRVSRVGTDIGFSFPTQGMGELTSLEKVDDIRHFWNEDGNHVHSYSKKQHMYLPWPHTIIAIPSELSEVAKDMKDFVKKKVVHVRITDRVNFNLGDKVSLKKGNRELLQATRMYLDNGEWSSKIPDEPIDANYFHGFYAILQNLKDDHAVELHFINLLGGWMCWIHAIGTEAELNYLVPFDK